MGSVGWVERLGRFGDGREGWERVEISHFLDYFHKFQEAPTENSIFSCLVCINLKSYKAFIIST